MNSRRVKIVIMIVSLLFFVIITGVIVSMHGIDKQTEDTTTFYVATVKSIHIAGTTENTYAEIFTNEYDSALRVSTNIASRIDIDGIRELNKGQTIFFRIENFKVEQMDQVEFLDIVSLSTNVEEIYNLDEYNKHIHNAAHPARITGVVMAVASLIAALFCCIATRKTGKKEDGSVR